MVKNQVVFEYRADHARLAVDSIGTLRSFLRAPGSINALNNLLRASKALYAQSQREADDVRH